MPCVHAKCNRYIFLSPVNLGTITSIFLTIMKLPALMNTWEDTTGVQHILNLPESLYHFFHPVIKKCQRLHVLLPLNNKYCHYLANLKQLFKNTASQISGKYI